MHPFKAKIGILGINPYVIPPSRILKVLFKEAKKDKGAIPVHCRLDQQPFRQTLVKYKSYWRLYLNMPMRKAIGKAVGDQVLVEIQFDARERIVPMPPGLLAALKQNGPAHQVFKSLNPSRQKEIKRYINHLKTQTARDRNIAKVIQFLIGKQRFAGRDRP